MFRRKNKNIREVPNKIRRRVRIVRLKRANKTYYEALVSLPRDWIRRQLLARGIDPDNPPPDVNLEVVIVYDGEVVIKPG